jgi:ATP-dependent Clp protease ATP-binding subunit ClpC
MFERYTDRARRVLVLAQVEAKKLNHNYIGTEHFLLGLIAEGEGVAAKALESLGISLSTVQQQVRELAGQGQDPPSGHIPFTPQAKKVLDLAQRESRALGHTYIGTEHILLGLLREGDGVAVQVLVSLGADLNTVRQRVIQLLHGHQGKAVADVGSRLGRRARGRQAGEALARIDSLNLDDLDGRLAAIERWVGMQPDLEDLEATASRLPIAREVDRLNSELQRLRAILRDHGIEPDDDVA